MGTTALMHNERTDARDIFADRISREASRYESDCPYVTTSVRSDSSNYRSTRNSRTAPYLLFISPRTDDSKQNLSDMFQIRDTSAIKESLTVHPYLSKALGEIYKHIKTSFNGKVHKVTLEQLIDPEENHVILYVKVISELSPAESLDLLDEFDKWWLDQDYNIRQHITVMV